MTLFLYFTNNTI